MFFPRKPINPLKVTQRIIDIMKVSKFPLFEFITSCNRQDLYNELWKVIYNHEFEKVLFGETYPTGELEEWMFCKKCNKMTVHKTTKDKEINMEEFLYCPKCGEKTEYHCQKLMYQDVYKYRMRDMVTMDNNDQVLRYVNDMLDLKEQAEKETIKLDKQIEENINKFNK